MFYSEFLTNFAYMNNDLEENEDSEKIIDGNNCHTAQYHCHTALEAVSPFISTVFGGHCRHC